jgi:MYXO-CTERM domain-containing protein
VGKTKAKVAPPETAATVDAQAPSTPDASGAGGTTGVSNPDEASGANSGGTAPNPPPIANPETPPGENGGGCRKGCSATPTPSSLGWVGLPLLLGAGLLRRRRRASVPVPRRANKK